MTKFSSSPTTTKEQWLELALSGLPDNEEMASLGHQTLDGLSVDVLYSHYPDETEATPNPLLGTKYYTELQSKHSPSQSWDNRLSVSAGEDTERTNQQILRGLSGGNTSIEVWMDSTTPTLGKLFNGVQLDLAAVSIRGHHAIEQTIEELKAQSSTTETPLDSIQCELNIDPIGNFLSGTAPGDTLTTSIESLGHTAQYAFQELPACRCIVIDSAVHHNAGASASQELHAIVATAALYLECLLNQGWSVKQAQHQIILQVACDADLLMSVIKLRSLRILWQHLLDQFSRQNSLEQLPYASAQITVETSRRYLSKIDYWNNHLRNISAATAAALVNADTIIVHPHDHIDGVCLGEDPVLGERLARNLPIILAQESMLTAVNDPLAGSYAIETLTASLVNNTWETLQETQHSKNWLEQLTSGAWQEKIRNTQAQRVSLLETEQRIAVGVNRFQAKPTAIAQTMNKTVQQHPMTLNPIRDAETFERTQTPAEMQVPAKPE